MLNAGERVTVGALFACLILPPEHGRMAIDKELWVHDLFLNGKPQRRLKVKVSGECDISCFSFRPPPQKNHTSNDGEVDFI